MLEEFFLCLDLYGLGVHNKMSLMMCCVLYKQGILIEMMSLAHSIKISERSDDLRAVKEACGPAIKLFLWNRD